MTMSLSASIGEIWRTGGRKERWFLLGIAGAVVFLVVSAFMAAFQRNDLDIFLEASRDILAGENVYQKKYSTWYTYFYSPLFALVIAPLSHLPLPLAKLIWSLLGLAAVTRTFRLIGDWLLGGLSRVEILGVVFFSSLFLLQSVRDNINAMQVTLLLVWLCVEGLALIGKGRWVLGAALIAFGIDMKMIPLVLLPYLIWRARWKAAVAVVVWVGVLHVLPAPVLGWDRLNELNAARATVLDPNSPRHIVDEEEPGFIALGSLLSAYLSDLGGNDHSPDLPRNLVNLNVQQLGWLLLIGRLILAGAALLFLQWPPFRPVASPLRAAYEVAYLLLVCVLFFPHQRNYSFYLAAPAVLCIARKAALRMRTVPRPTGLFIVLALVYLLSDSELLLGEFGLVYQHYKVLSFMVLALVVLLYWARPKEALPTTAS